jgi:hypothetical protein
VELYPNRRIYSLILGAVLQLGECIDYNSVLGDCLDDARKLVNALIARNDMKILLAAAALAIAGVVTVQAADIAPVTAHWMRLGEHFSALVYYIDEPDAFHVVVTTQQGPRENYSL